LVKLKHLPFDQWPEADIEAFARAFKAGDVFDNTAGPGAHLAEGTRKMIICPYRRWLKFLRDHDPEALLEPPADRITLDRVRAFVDHLDTEIRPTSVAIAIDNLHYAARLLAPERDWRWLASIKRRLLARAKPEDRFHHLVPPSHILDFAIELMEEALGFPSDGHKQAEIQYRDGLLLALLTLSHFRRRSIAALTVSRHLEFNAGGINVLLFPEDTKSKRNETFRVHEQVLPYFLRYLRKIRPRLLGRSEHDGLWASYRGRPLSESQIYSAVRKHIKTRFGKDMSLHDFRRAGATFLAMDAPGKIGLIPGMLQQASPEVGEQHYNLAGAMEASRRHGAHLAEARGRLRPILKTTEG
jgi:integrase/recombinase XerD